MKSLISAIILTLAIITASSTLLAALAQSASEFASAAFALHKQGQHDKASALAEQAISVGPECPDAYFVRGTIRYQHAGDLIGAKADLDKAIALNPTFAVAYAARGTILFDQKNYAAALADFSKSMQLRPDVVSNYEARGNTYVQLKNYNAAIADFNQCIKLNPNQHMPYLRRGEAYVKLQRWDLALADVSKGLEVKQTPELFANRGWINFKLKHYSDSMADYNRALALDPKCWRAYQVKGYIYQERRQYKQAIELLNKALEMKPGEADCLEARGDCYLDLGQYDKGLSDYLAASKGQPEYPSRLRKEIVVAYEFKNDYAKALAACNEALKLEPKSAPLLIERSNCYRHTNQVDKALADVESVLSVDKKNKDAIFAKARCLWAKDDTTKAIEFLDQTLKNTPLDRETRLLRAKCEQEIGKYDAAIIDYSILLKLDPKDEEVRVLRAGCWSEWGRYYRAANDYSIAMELNPKDEDSHWRRARALIHAGDYYLAEADLKALIAANPNYASAWGDRAFLSVRSNNISKALNEANVAINLDAKSAVFLTNRAEVHIARGDYSAAIADCEKGLKLAESKDTPVHIDTLLQLLQLKYTAECLSGHCDVALAGFEKLFRDHAKDLETKGNSTFVKQNYRMLKHIVAAGNRAKQFPELCPQPVAEPADDIDKAFANRMKLKHTVVISDASKELITYYAQFSELFHKWLESDFLKTKLPDKVTTIYLFPNGEKLEEFAKKNKIQGEYWPERNAILTHNNNRRFATIARQLTYNALTETLPETEPWARAGIPDLFSRYFGYFEKDSITPYYGYDNYHSLMSFVTHPDKLKIQDLLLTDEGKDIKSDTSRQRLLAVFLAANNLLDEYIKRVKNKDKGEYKTYVEAAFKGTASELQPMWHKHLRWTARNAEDWLDFPISEMFDSKEELQKFMHDERIPMPGEIFLQDGVVSDQPVS